MAVLQGQDGLVLQIRQCHGFAFGQTMIRVQGEQQRLFDQLVTLKATHFFQPRQHQQIQIAIVEVLQQAFGLLFIEEEIDVGQFLHQPRHDMR